MHYNFSVKFLTAVAARSTDCSGVPLPCTEEMNGLKFSYIYPIIILIAVTTTTPLFEKRQAVANSQLHDCIPLAIRLFLDTCNFNHLTAGVAPKDCSSKNE